MPIMRYGTVPKDANAVTVPTVVSAPWCDAKLAHEAWASAATAGGFTVRMSHDAPATQTEVKLVSDGRNLQIAFKCAEPDMTSALAPSAGEDDHVIVVFDPGLTRQDQVVFNVHLSGARSGSLAEDAWQGAALAGDDGWTGQMLIPFASLGCTPADGEVWGLQLARVRQGGDAPEVATWSPADLNIKNPRDLGLLCFQGEMDLAAADRTVNRERQRLQAGEDLADHLEISRLGPAQRAHSDGEIDLSAGTHFHLADAKIEVASADNPRIARGQYPFFYEAAEHPDLRELRERYALDSVIDGADDDFDEAIRLQLWVIDHLNFGSPAHHDYRALKLLEDCEMGRSFYCTHFSYVFMQCCMAVGINCRKVSTIGHASDEFWSNRYGKWCTLECTRGHFFEKNGVPLSALEVHNEYALNGGVDMDYSVGTDRAIRKVNLDLTPDGKMIADAQERYLWFAALMRNNILSVPFDIGELRWLMWIDDANRNETEMEVHRGRGPTRYREPQGVGWEPIRIEASCEDDLYWTLNTARLHLRPCGDSLSVIAETQTPNFARFESRIDGGEWKPSPAAFMWTPHKGENSLEVRPVCAFAREGKAASVVLKA